MDLAINKTDAGDTENRGVGVLAPTLLGYGLPWRGWIMEELAETDMAYKAEKAILIFKVRIGRILENVPVRTLQEGLDFADGLKASMVRDHLGREFYKIFGMWVQASPSGSQRGEIHA